MVKLRRRFRRIERFLDAHDTIPFLTIALVAICVAVFAVQGLTEGVWEQFRFTPALAAERPWTFLTSMFLHAGSDHLIFNMFMLFWFGWMLEAVIGVKRRYILVTFLLAGLAGGLADILTLPPYVSALGASGAIMGLVGLRCVSYPSPIAILLAIFYGGAAISGVLSPTGNIAHGSHLGGLIVGVVLAIYWIKTRKISWSVW